MFINLTNIDFCPCNNGNSGGGSGDVKLQTKGVKYTLNGEYVIDPDEGYDGLSGVGVIVNVSGPAPTLQPISKTYTSNGTYSIIPEEGYDGLSNVDVVVNVPTTSEPNLQSKSNTYTTNGTYTITPDEGYDGLSSVEVTFNYQGTSPGGQIGTVDVDGLKAIGWDNETINYLNNHTLHYSWEDAQYKVTDDNKALYGVVNSNNVSSYKNNPDFIFCPYFDTAGVMNMGNMFSDFSNMISIPLLDMSNVTSMSWLFNNCTSLQTIPPLNTSSVTKTDHMFSNCTSLKTIPQLDTSNVTNMDGMFYSCSNLSRIEGLDMSRVSDASNMFVSCSKLSYIRLTGSLNTSLDLSYTTLLDYDSVKSVLTAASNTTNTDRKTLKFNSTLTDQNGELASLVSTCTAKGWTVSGLTLN